jgi:hypothetical protein
MDRYEAFKPFRKLLLEEYNLLLSVAGHIEDEVLRADKYWKSSDALNRLLIEIRRSKDRTVQKYAECVKVADALEKAEADSKQNEPKAIPETPVIPEGNDKMAERFDRREEMKHPDPLERGLWNF